MEDKNTILCSEYTLYKLSIIYAFLGLCHCYYQTLYNNYEASADLKRTWRELAKAYFMKYYPSISLEGGEISENPEWAAFSLVNI